MGHVPVKTSHDPLDVAFRKKVVTALENKDMEQVLRKAELAIPGAHLNNTELGKLHSVTTKVVEGLFASDFGYLQDFYRVINFGDPSILESVEPGTPFPKESLAVG